MNAQELSVVVSTLWLGQTETGAQPAATPPAAGAPRVPGAVGTQGTGTATQQPVGPGTVAPGQPQSAPSLFNSPIMLIAFALLAMVVVTSMTGRKEKKRRAQLLSAIKKYDKVQTLGGIIGTVVELGETEITLRVDEASNTRIRFARSAIQGVLKEGKDDGKQSANVEAKPKAENATV